MPSLGNLFGARLYRTLVAVGLLTDVALFVDALRRSATAFLVLVLRSLRVAGPSIIQQMKILFLRRRSNTFNPYSHRVRTIFPRDATFRSCSSSADIQALQVLPRCTQRQITRTDSTYSELRDTHRTVCHISTITGSTRFLIHKRKLESRLVDIRTMPFGQLLIAVELISPILKMAIRQLLCQHNYRSKDETK